MEWRWKWCVPLRWVACENLRSWAIPLPFVAGGMENASQPLSPDQTRATPAEDSRRKCWRSLLRAPCIHPAPITSPTSPQNTRVSCGWARSNCVCVCVCFFFFLCHFIVLSHWNSKSYLIWQLASLSLINMSKILWPGETGDILNCNTNCLWVFVLSFFICLLCAYVLFLGSSKEWNS